MGASGILLGLSVFAGAESRRLDFAEPCHDSQCESPQFKCEELRGTEHPQCQVTHVDYNGNSNMVDCCWEKQVTYFCPPNTMMWEIWRYRGNRKICRPPHEWSLGCYRLDEPD
ncbi:MAG: hypothetical protein KF884_12775 [Fimbriimonadaceae bacterium]|nr:hypothetical protein [Fimbriimonadaceae bacterium]QYK58415.1 MAG: hypothetical protein KF884_12775 [Fimbriimonadaceae bacterium]